MNNKPIINQELVNRIDELLSHGLTSGLGEPEPGKMCVEAMICYALGEEHSDHPSCVPIWLAELKIRLNDAHGWKSKKERAEILRPLAIAQLGSLHIKQEEFMNKLWLKTHQRILPKIIKDSEWKIRFSEVKSKEEFESLWTEFKAGENYKDNYYNYYYNDYNNYYNNYYDYNSYNSYNDYYYDYYNNYNYYNYHYYEDLYQDIVTIMVECLKEFNSEGSKFV